MQRHNKTNKALCTTLHSEDTKLASRCMQEALNLGTRFLGADGCILVRFLDPPFAIAVSVLFKSRCMAMPSKFSSHLGSSSYRPTCTCRFRVSHLRGQNPVYCVQNMYITYIYVHTRIFCKYFRIYVYLQKFLYLYKHMQVCMYVCMYVCMSVPMYGPGLVRTPLKLSGIGWV